MNQQAIESATKAVYGNTFALYDVQAFLSFLAPLEKRLEANGISQEVFKGKRCLDAGCGGGRATVLMARAGAREVVSYDLSERNVATTTRNAANFGLTNVRVQCGSLMELPFANQEFDVVWCNGVLHHTTDPGRSLREVTRVLKVGGFFWLYLYGSGGIYWYLVDFIRNWLADVTSDEAIAFLSALGTPTGNIAEFIDDWFVPMLKRYTHEDVSRALATLGFAAPGLLTGGVAYDTSVRRQKPGERGWMGEGDLRYWCQKTAESHDSNAALLPDVDGKGSAYEEATEVLACKVPLEELAGAVRDLESKYPRLKNSIRVALAARLQTLLRNQFTASNCFDGKDLVEWLKAESLKLENLLGCEPHG
jgi:ubiquinone/menaquinone biosynthesis C-methylase UbiE